MRSIRQSPTLWELPAEHVWLDACIKGDLCATPPLLPTAWCLLPTAPYAVAMRAASSRPISLMEIYRILYFWVLPLMVVGKESTNLT